MCRFHRDPLPLATISLGRGLPTDPTRHLRLQRHTGVMTHQTMVREAIQLEWRTIFRQVTIFRHLFWISCNFFILYRNIFLSAFSNEFQYVLTNSFKEMIKFCPRILKIIIVKCGEIWFLWRNMVLCSIDFWWGLLVNMKTVWGIGCWSTSKPKSKVYYCISSYQKLECHE